MWCNIVSAECTQICGFVRTASHLHTAHLWQNDCSRRFWA